MDRSYISHYREHGYAVVPGLFTPEEIGEIAERFDRVYAQGLAYGASFRHGNVLFRVTTDPALGRVVRLVQWPSYFDAVLARYRTDARMLELVRPLIGANVKQIINQMHWKPAGAKAEFGFHQDVRFRRPRSAFRDLATTYVQTGIAIDRHRPETGAMTIVKGSHRRGEISLPGGADRVMDRSLDRDDLAALAIDPADIAVLELAPGDVALWSVYLLHGSGPNIAGGERRFYLNGYVAGEACERGEWAFRGGLPCPLGPPALVHYEELALRPEPHYVAG